MKTQEGTEAARKPTLDDLNKSFLVSCISDIRTTVMKDLGGHLSTFTSRFIALPDELQSHILDLYRKGNVTDSTFDLMLFKMVVNNVDPQLIDDVVTYFHYSDEDHQEFAVMMFEKSSVPVQYQPFQIDISGLKHYRLQGFNYDPQLPIRKQDDRTRLQIEALHKFHAYSYSLPSEWSTGRDPIVKVTANNQLEQIELAQYVVDHPERADDVLDVIKERGRVDMEVISTVIENPSSALGSGAL